MIKFQITGYDQNNFVFTVNYYMDDAFVNDVLFSLLHDCPGIDNVEEIKQRIAQRGIEEIRKFKFKQNMLALIGQNIEYPVHEVENLPSLHNPPIVQVQEIV